jgi:DNA repair exonuclease SbcCD ATPase subunit
MEISAQLQEQLSSRQKGMCGQCGKKIDEIDSAEKVFLALDSKFAANPTLDQSVLICNYCFNESKHITANADNYSLKKYQFPYAGYENYTIENKIEDLKDEVDRTLESIKNASDIRDSRYKLSDKIKLVRSFSLDKETFEALHNKLTSALDELNQRQRQEYEKLEKQQIENFATISVKVEEAIKAVEEIAEFKEARDKLIAVQSEMNNLTLKRENKDELVQKLNATFQVLNKRQSDEWEKYEMECSENYLTLKSKVEAAISFAETHPIFKECREKLIEAQKEFKGLRLKKDNREELFSRIQNAFTALNSRQDSEREGFDKEADENYEKIKPVVSDAIAFAKDVTNFKQGREALIDAQSAIKGLKLRKDHRDELYAAIRETFDGLNERQSAEREVFDKETGENHDKLNAQLDRCADELNADPEFNKIRDILIAVQGEVKILNLKREQRNTLFTRIRELFAILDVKRKEYRENKAAEKKNKLQSILTNLQNKLGRIEESISWDIKSLNFQKEKLENINADEDPSAVEDIKNKSAMFEERIKEKETSIEETKKRIEDIEKEMAEQAQA